MHKIVLLGDIGGTRYHVGDEAMASACVEELERRLDVTVVSPGATSRPTADPRIEPIASLGFLEESRSRAGAEDRLRSLAAVAKGSAGALPSHDPVHQVVAAVRDADLVVISGGGNLCSFWPPHIYERAALATVANQLGTPLVVSGQSIGPALTRRDGELVATVLNGAQLVGVRERSSHLVALKIGVPPDRLVLTPDDAAFLDPDPGDPPQDRPPYVSATFAEHGGLLDSADYVAAAARIVETLGSTSGLEVILVPHYGARRAGFPDADQSLHDQIAERVGQGVVSLAVPDARRAVAIARDAELVVSSRYHPGVFALAAGTAAIGLGLDSYTSAKIGGSFAHVGCEDLVLTAPSVISGDAPSVVEAVWSHGDEIRSHLEPLTPHLREVAERWWDSVAGLLDGRQRSSIDLEPPRKLSFDPPAIRRSARMRSWADSLSRQLDATRLAGP